MEFIVLLGAPLLGAVTLGLFGHRRRAPEINIAFSLATFLAACALTFRVINEGNLLAASEQFFIDAFNVFLVTLTAFVGLTTSLFSRPYMRIEMEHGRVSASQLRLYHSMYQLFMTTMLVALTTNNLGLMWVAMEAATLSTVLLVTLYRTPASLEAGWKYFILCGVGIAQALFGTILLYFAAEKILGAEGVSALLWTHLNGVKGELEPAVLGLAFVFMLVGYGAKVGLAPLHNWLPDAHAEGPTPISAVLSGLLLNVALYAVIRCKVLVEGSLQSSLPGRMLMGFGLLSVVLAAFFLWRQRDIKRLFAYSSIEHMGIITFAFGMGGPGRELRGAAAHDRALADEIRHLLRRGPCLTEGGLAAHGGHTRAGHPESDRGLGIDAWVARDSRNAAVRRVCERVPDSYDSDARTTVGGADPVARARRCVRRDLRPRAADGVWRDVGKTPSPPSRAASCVHASRSRAAARRIHSAVARRLVPRRGAPDRRRMRWCCDGGSNAACGCRALPAPRN